MRRKFLDILNEGIEEVPPQGTDIHRDVGDKEEDCEGFKKGQNKKGDIVNGHGRPNDI